MDVQTDKLSYKADFLAAIKKEWEKGENLKNKINNRKSRNLFIPI